MPLLYEASKENCEIFIDASFTKTKSPDVLILSFNNIKYADINNYKYLEIEKLNLIITVEINTLVSNFSYKL